MNKSSHSYKMNDLYAMIGITKQAFYKRLARLKHQEATKQYIISMAKALREEHTKMGCRKLYDEIRPQGMGRDRVEALLLQEGFRIPRKRSYRRTTYAGGLRYENLISGKTLNDRNQLWVSDITYIPVGYKKFYYLTLVQDVYSKVIKGWSLSKTLETKETVLPCLKQALKPLTKRQKGKLIFHSDRGSQYGSDAMKELYEDAKIKPSMGGKAWENAHAESINGVLKNEYINFDNRNVSLQQANSLMEKWIYLYNYERPHGSLKNRKPMEYENYLKGLPKKQRDELVINY